VLISGPFIRNTEIKSWQSAVEALDTTLQGQAILACMEPELAVTLKATTLGALEMNVDISPDPLNQEHRFTFSIDQSYLKQLSSQCESLLRTFPIRGAGAGATPDY
jgi:hypothetical protein